jgi:hypothetical protein
LVSHEASPRPEISNGDGMTVPTDEFPRTVLVRTGETVDRLVEHERGVTEVPGLYFLGLPWQHTRGSALLGWVNDDAQYLAQRIGALAQSHAPARAR